MPDSKIPAVVKRFYGDSAVVQLANGSEHSAQTSSRNKSLVCGDLVKMEERSGSYYVVETESRRTEFFRTDGFGRRKVIAANVDQILLVVAPKPEPHPTSIDRYWVAARLCEIPMQLIINKADQIRTDRLSEIEQLYTSLGLEIHWVSAHDGTGIFELQGLLAKKTSVLVGQSGVGKSSLVNSLSEGCDVEVGELSEQRAEGRHTTTTTNFYDLGGGARVLDSPGIREFGLDHYDQKSLEYGFSDIYSISSECRFRDCVHNDTPGCAVEAATKNGQIDSRRLVSYRQLLSQIS